MYCLTASASIVFACLTVVTSQLPCNSQLRLLPSFAHLFTHCECSYSEWTEWSLVNTTEVPFNQCASGRVLIEERWQRVLNGDCDDRREERSVCEPDIADQLILAFGLGSTGHHIDPNVAAYIIPDNSTTHLQFKRSPCNGNEQVCHHVTTPRGRRSVREELKRPHFNRRRSTAEPEPLPTDPTPFNPLEHGARYRRQQDSTCYPDGIQHILFVLDTSGSIGEIDFNQMTAALSTLVPLFCKPIKVAVMTFDHEYFVEFCFNCFENTCTGRRNAGSAIGNINYYRGDGTRYTHTGGAAQCVCDVILTPSCGLDPAANCIDVVFITDGKSNDPNRDVCNDILCLHNRFGVNTFAIGIGNAHKPELECITENDVGPGEFHLFNFPSFYDFRAQIELAIIRLGTGSTNSNGDPYVCIDPDGAAPGLGAESCF